MNSPLVVDLEIYTNFTLIILKHVETKQVTRFELPLDELDQEILRTILSSHTILTFNGTGYDMCLMQLILRGDSSLKIKKASDRIIVQHLRWWHFEKEFNVKVAPPWLDHVDLMEVAPLTGSLKLYAGKMHSKSLQDLPIDPAKLVTEEDKVILRSYCENDCDSTIDLYNALKSQLALREQMSAQYKIDLRSKSDAQIAEAVIKSEVEAITKKKLDKPGHSPGDRFRYKPPEWMRFKKLDILDTIRGAWFVVTDTGGILMPPELKSRKIALSKGVYKLGVGGLHSSETKQVVKEDADHIIIDFDVTGFYPAIILNERLYPKHIGPVFLQVYTKIVADRLAAKATGQKTTSESLKIVANATYGKLGSKWSALYSPDLVIQVTVTGQLSLLMLIEALDDIVGVEVISANTDGTSVRCRRDTEQEALAVVKEWEKTTGFTLERADYAALYSRDVNSYVAIKTNGSGVKTKGAYGQGLPLHKNVMHQICSKAVINFLQFDASIEGTIFACSDIRKFLCMRTVKGGAMWRGQEVGKVIRYYHATGIDDAIFYKVNKHLVPDTHGVRPAIMLPNEIPCDLDRSWYIKKAYEMLNDLGVAK